MSTDEAREMILNVLAGLEIVDDKQKNDLLEARTEDIEFAGLGIDSIAVVNFCVGLEDRIGREIAVEELIENPTVNKLADHFAREGV